MPFFVYMLECGDGSYYTGHTDDLERRIADHEDENGFSDAPSLYVKKHMRVELVWFQEFPTRDEALVRERQIKGWSRAKKIALIERDWQRLSTLSKGRERSA